MRSGATCWKARSQGSSRRRRRNGQRRTHRPRRRTSSRRRRRNKYETRKHERTKSRKKQLGSGTIWPILHLSFRVFVLSCFRVEEETSSKQHDKAEERRVAGD